MAVKLKVHEDSTRLTVHGDGAVAFTAEQGFPVYPEMQRKSVRYTPSESAIADTVTPDSGYGGLTEVGVAVDAIPPNYIGSNVPRRSGSDLTEEGGTVTAPAGYYSQEASKAVPELDSERCIIDFGRYYDTDDGERFWKIYGYFQETDGIGGYVEPYTRIDGDVMWFNAIPTGTTVTPREARQTIGGANVMMEGGVTVEAIPSNYVGSGITRRSRDDLSGDYDTDAYWVDGPAGYYADNFDYEVPNGTEGTPSASKGAVSNHTVQVTPSVTNAAGYITGGTKTGTPVTVTAAELVSGSQTLTENNTYNVTDLEEVVVDVQVPAPTLVPYAIRPDAELVATYTYDKHAHADEGWTIPAYNTAAQTLKAAANLSPTVTVDLTNYRYIVVERFLTIPEYSVTTKGKGRQEYTFCSYVYEITRAAANEIATIIDPTKKITGVQYMVATNTLYRLLYWTSSTAIGLYASNGYGAYMTPSAPAASGTTLTLKAPAFCVRGSTTYFTSTYMNALTDIRYQYVIEVYRTPVNNLNVDGWEQDQAINHIIDCATSTDHKLT